MRGVLHAQHRRQPGRHQDHRMRDRRPRHRAGLEAGAADNEDRQEGRHRRLGTGRPRLRAAARARRARRARVRKIRQGGRPDALRHPRFQNGEASRRQARRADGAGRRDLPLRRPCRREPAGREARRRARRRGAGRRRRKGPRPADPGPRTQGHPLRHGLLAAAEPARERRAARRQRADPRQRQARRRHRRRRYRLRLHRHLVPPGRALGDQFRDHAAAARDGKQDAHLAGLAAEAAHLV